MQDLNNVFNQIIESYQMGIIPYANYLDYLSLVGFGCYTAQRTYSTIKKITIGMVRDALRNGDYSVFIIPPMMDKIRYQHYVPLDPCLVTILKETIKYIIIMNRFSDISLFTVGLSKILFHLLNLKGFSNPVI